LLLRLLERLGICGLERSCSGVKAAQVLDVVVGRLEFMLQPRHLVLELVDQHHLGVLVLQRNVGNITGLHRVVQGGDILFQELVRGRQTSDHQGERVASQRLLEQTRQLRLTEGYVFVDLLALACVGQGRNYLSEGEQRFVNVD